MSIQDDIFDIDAMLKGKSGNAAWARVKRHLYALEQENDRQEAILMGLVAGTKAIKLLMQGVQGVKGIKS